MPNYSLRTKCIEWPRARSPEGYGRTWFRGRLDQAHRVAWIKAFGEIPGKLWVLHRCDNPPCINTDHLFLGTHSDNMQDAASKGHLATANKRKMGCPQGHIYDAIDIRGSRYCKKCHNQRRRIQRVTIGSDGVLPYAKIWP